jgi:hypothetical protein
MRRFRVSIAGLMGVVLFVAVAVAALREASAWGAGALFALTLGAIGFAVLRAAYRTGPKRAFWAGFALFASGYLGACFLPGGEERPRPPTYQALEWLYGKLVLQPAGTTYAFTSGGQVLELQTVSVGTTIDATNRMGSGLATVAFTSPTTGGGATVLRTFLTADLRTFQHVGHCLLAVVAGMLGGGLARWQQSGGARATVVPSASPAPTGPEAPCEPAAS